MTETDYTELGPLSRSIRMSRILSGFCCGAPYTRSSNNLKILAEVAPLIAMEYQNVEPQCCFSLKDTLGKDVKTFEFIDNDILREKTRKGPVYWISTSNGRYVSTNGDYFEYTLIHPNDDIRADAWHLRKYCPGRGYLDTKRDGKYMHYLNFTQRRNGAIICQRKVTKNGVVISWTQNGKPISSVLNGQKKGAKSL